MQGLPPDVLDGISAQMATSWHDADVHPVGGGCIHPAARLVRPSVGAGPSGSIDPPYTEVFVKWSRQPGPAGFSTEAAGLEALAHALQRGDGPADSDQSRGNTSHPDLVVPRVLGAEEGRDGVHGWLLLEYLPPSTPTAETASRLGRGLAMLHRPAGRPTEDGGRLEIESGPTAADPDPDGDDIRPGWHRDGVIGPLPQSNDPAPWPEFWATRRIGARLDPLRTRGILPDSTLDDLDRVLDRIDEALPTLEPHDISLLHGDLWRGNVHITTDGTPALVDPALYLGHREVDLAMMELFGGFDARTLDIWAEAWPPAPGWESLRRPLYQLYPLLVHVELFGGGYVDQTARLARRLRAETGG